MPLALDLESVRDTLRRYYGEKLRSSSDLATAACCSDETARRFVDTLRMIPEEVKARQYGCGSPLPMDDLAGLTVVDFGCGAGTDAFIASRLVGPEGRVIGIDLTEEQLEVGRRALPGVMQRFGFPETNVDFRTDLIEVAETVDDDSVDLVISNCVINLSPRKDRILRPGGEFYISDILCDRRLPDEVRTLDSHEYSECLTGAEYTHDLHDIMEAAGFRDVRLVGEEPVEETVGREGARFVSATLRGFKMVEPPLDRRCEDYGQIATYLGGAEEMPVRFRLDEGHEFERGRPVAVCRNTAWMLERTRLARYFRVTPPVQHFGLFDCGPTGRAAGEVGGSGGLASGACC